MRKIPFAEIEPYVLFKVFSSSTHGYIKLLNIEHINQVTRFFMIRHQDLSEIQGAYGGSWGFPSGATKATTHSAANVPLNSRNSLDDPRRSKDSTRTVVSARQKPGGSGLPPPKGR